jgi:hypothetical protein
MARFMRVIQFCDKKLDRPDKPGDDELVGYARQDRRYHRRDLRYR